MISDGRLASKVIFKARSAGSTSLATIQAYFLKVEYQQGGVPVSGLAASTGPLTLLGLQDVANHPTPDYRLIWMARDSPVP